MADPSPYLIGQEGGQNIYEFGVARYAAIGGDNAYNKQRDNIAATICPHRYQLIDGGVDSRFTFIGVRQATQIVIRIACPV